MRIANKCGNGREKKTRRNFSFVDDGDDEVEDKTRIDDEEDNDRTLLTFTFFDALFS